MKVDRRLIGWMAVAAALLAPGLGAPAARASDGGVAEVVTAGDGTPNSRVPMSSGTRDSAFSLRLPAGAACSGDSMSGQYRVQSFMVPSGTDPSSLVFEASGPTPTGLGAAFRQPLFTTDKHRFTNAATNTADRKGGSGAIINLPTFDLTVFPEGDLPAGDYAIGIACTKGAASPTQLDRYWVAEFHVGSRAGDGGLEWTTAALPPAGKTAGTTPLPQRGTAAGDSAAATTASAPSVALAPQSVAPTGADPSFGPPLAEVQSFLAPGVAPIFSVVRWLLLALVFARIAFLLVRTSPFVPARVH